MAKSNVFDGYPIDIYEGKFSGTFTIQDEYGEDMAYEDVVAFVVVGTLSNASIKTVYGDTKRVNTFKVGFAAPLTVEEGEIVRKAMNWETIYGEQLSLLPPAERKEISVKPAYSEWDEAGDEPQAAVYDEDVFLDDGDEEDYTGYTEPASSGPIVYKDTALASFLYPEGR